MIESFYIKPSSAYLHGRILQHVYPKDRVLDLGAGLADYHRLLKVRGAHVTAVDAYAPYVEREREIVDAAVQSEIVPFLRDARRGAFEVALLIDVIEHLRKPDALEVLQLVDGVADITIVFTPGGFMPQDRDNYGLGGDHWQTHRSGWEPTELEKVGFEEIEVWREFHDRPELGRKFDAIYAVR